MSETVSSIPPSGGASAAAPDAALFSSPPPVLTSDTAAEIVAELYGVKGVARPLHSERDANFLIETDEARYTLKISNAAEPAERIDCNTAVLLHLQRSARNAPTPRLVPTKDGAVQASSERFPNNIIRLLTYLDGVPLSAMSPTDRPLRSIGACLGVIDQALADFRHPAMHFELIWNSARVEALTVLAEHITDPEARRFAERQLQSYCETTAPALSALPHQMIHNDANLGNMLTAMNDPTTIAGLFDFGDMVVAPSINELAVAAGYHIFEGQDPIAVLCELASGYHSERPLASAECAVLPGLIRARLLTTILITHWRASLFPENQDYILRNNPSAWSGLRLLDDVEDGALVDSVCAACGLDA
ncbi:MAG: phosphotransferase [Pseudomonadota bacterium]